MLFNGLLQISSDSLKQFFCVIIPVTCLSIISSACGPGTGPNFNGAGLPTSPLADYTNLDAAPENNQEEQAIPQENSPDPDDTASEDDGSSNESDHQDDGISSDTSGSGEDSGDSSLDAVSDTPDNSANNDNYEGHSYQHLLEIDLPENTKVDILWVIDSSLSMSEEQEYLGNNFSSLITALAGSNQDFQTAVTTTDICSDEIPDDLSLRACPFAYGGSSQTHLRGSFVGEEGRRVLTASDADLEDKFKEYTNVGTLGSNFEHGLRASSMAIEKELSGENEDLMRDGAFLAVIVISDEEDDGIGLGNFDPFLNFNPTQEGMTTYSYTNDELINYLNDIKGQGNFSVSTITGTRLDDGNLCTSAHSSPSEEGSALIDAASKTGGIVLSICDTDWGESLQNLGNDLNAQISQVTLDKIPEESSIKVEVNDVEHNNWTFIEGNNSVKFDSDAIPSPGSKISIYYNSQEP